MGNKQQRTTILENNDIVKIENGSIVFIGYLYDTGDKDEKPWRWNTFGNMSYKLSEFNQEEIDDAEMAAQQYCDDITIGEAIDIWRSYNPELIALDQINEDTPEGYYVLNQYGIG